MNCCRSDVTTISNQEGGEWAALSMLELTPEFRMWGLVIDHRRATGTQTATGSAG